MFVLAYGEAAVVRAQITGSIIGTGLLGLGVAIVAGGVGRERQTFKRERAGLLSSLLILAVIALLLPAVFNLAEAAAGERCRWRRESASKRRVWSQVILERGHGDLVLE
jgi:Ca2+:H+ antiporter